MISVLRIVILVAGIVSAIAGLIMHFNEKMRAKSELSNKMKAVRSGARKRQEGGKDDGEEEKLVG